MIARTGPTISLLFELESSRSSKFGEQFTGTEIGMWIWSQDFPCLSKHKKCGYDLKPNQAWKRLNKSKHGNLLESCKLWLSQLDDSLYFCFPHLRVMKHFSWLWIVSKILIWNASIAIGTVINRSNIIQHYKFTCLALNIHYSSCSIMKILVVIVGPIKVLLY